MGDDWKVSDRLTLNIGTRYTLNFPSTEVHNQGAVFNLKTQVLDFPHTARSLELLRFRPARGAAYRLSDSLVVRAGYGMIWFEQSGITTPFTFPQFPFIQTAGAAIGRQHRSRILAGPRPQRAAVEAPNPNSGLGQGVFAIAAE